MATVWHRARAQQSRDAGSARIKNGRDERWLERRATRPADPRRVHCRASLRLESDGAEMTLIQNWRGGEIEVASSRGGKLAVVDFADGLLQGGVQPWPPPELLQKLTRSAHGSAFDEPDLSAVRRIRGYYSDLQSLRSEDAVTWSVFGTVAYAASAVRAAYVQDLLQTLDVPAPADDYAIWLWRRVPHPETGGKNGPEIDFAIQGQSLVLFGEAKWGSGIGAGQGVNHNRNQLALRREFFERWSSDLFPNQTCFVLLTVSPGGGLQESGERPVGPGTLYERDATWEAISGLARHPLSEELGRYLTWKQQHI